jgi:hypothetical protein
LPPCIRAIQVPYPPIYAWLTFPVENYIFRKKFSHDLDGFSKIKNYRRELQQPLMISLSGVKPKGASILRAYGRGGQFLGKYSTPSNQTICTWLKQARNSIYITYPNLIEAPLFTSLAVSLPLSQKCTLSLRETDDRLSLRECLLPGCCCGGVATASHASHCRVLGCLSLPSAAPSQAHPHETSL